MAKTNFTKAEEALEKGIQKAAKDKLLNEADQAQGKSPSGDLGAIRLKCAVDQDLRWLRKKDKDLYSKLSISRESIKTLLKTDPAYLTKDQIDTLTSLRTECAALKQSLEKTSDDDIVEQQRQSHINKRFNIKDKWLPLK